MDVIASEYTNKSSNMLEDLKYPVQLSLSAAAIQDALKDLFTEKDNGDFACVVKSLKPAIMARFAKDLAGQTAVLAEMVVSGQYHPLPLGLTAIPKKKGGHRFIAPPDDEDRLVQRAILDLIMPVLTPAMHPSSYAYIPGRSCPGAILKAEHLLSTGQYHTVLAIDVKRCFASIPINPAMDVLRSYVRCKPIVTAIQASICARPEQRLIDRVRNRLAMAGTLTSDDKHNLRAFRSTNRGIPEGSPLSPLICNLYLLPLLSLLDRLGITFIQYADNLLLFLRSNQNATAIRDQFDTAAERLHLQLNHEQPIHWRDGAELEFLGVRLLWLPSGPYLCATDQCLENLACRVERAMTGRSDELEIRLRHQVIPYATAFAITDIIPIRQVIAHAGRMLPSYVLQNLLDVISYYYCRNAETMQTWGDEADTCLPLQHGPTPPVRYQLHRGRQGVSGSVVSILSSVERGGAVSRSLPLATLPAQRGRPVRPSPCPGARIGRPS